MLTLKDKAREFMPEAEMEYRKAVKHCAREIQPILAPFFF